MALSLSALHAFSGAMVNKVLLSLEEILLSFGGKPLFEGLTLHIAERDRICLIGQNGAGKTTLMRLMMEDLELDAGTRFLLPGTRIGYLAQKITYQPEDCVKDFVLSGLSGLAQEEREANAYLADMIISPLDLDPQQKMGSLSGGQRRRAALARALVEQPDILLLDEPTNHLDIAAIQWLESYLASFPGAVICVSHDRTFLGNVSRTVLWLDRGGIKLCPTGYSGFEEWQEKQVEHEARELQNLQKKVESEHGWTQGGVTARRKRNVRRMRELGRLREKLRHDKAAYKQRSQKIAMDALETPNASKIAAEFKRVSHCFDENAPLLDQFEHLILKGDRLGIVGRNGSGKSTFLRLLTNELTPDTGHIFRSKTLEFSYFDQNRSELYPEHTLWETLCPGGGQEVALGRGESAKSIHVCGYLKRFLFDPAMARNKVSTLSGGQQNRLLLAKTLASPGNLLILDEPTNDLDMQTLDMLQEMLADYPGTLIVVSHDRDFLDRTVTEMLVFEGDAKISHSFGGYSDYERSLKPKAVAKKAAETAKQSQPEPLNPMQKPLTYGEKLELEKIPDQLATYNQQLEEVQQKLDTTGLFERDPDGFHRLIAEVETIQKTIAEAEERWLELEERGLNTG